MSKRAGYIMLIAIVLLAASGCSTAIPENALSNVDKSITFAMLKANPSAYKDKTILVGGEIIKSTNKHNGTTQLEVIEFPLDNEYRPRKGDKSDGRFIVVYKGYLETEIFKPGRFVTVVGIVGENKKGTIGNMPYNFPEIDVTYLKLWPLTHTENMPAYSIGLGFDYGPYIYPPYWYYPYSPFFH